jgi:hypothetical protein
MQTKPEFHSIEFFRKIRDQQAAALSGKTPAEIIAFFSKMSAKRTGGLRRQAAQP